MQVRTAENIFKALIHGGFKMKNITKKKVEVTVYADLENEKAVIATVFTDLKEAMEYAYGIANAIIFDYAVNCRMIPSEELDEHFKVIFDILGDNFKNEKNPCLSYAEFILSRGKEAYENEQ